LEAKKSKDSKSGADAKKEKSSKPDKKEKPAKGGAAESAAAPADVKEAAGAGAAAAAAVKPPGTKVRLELPGGKSDEKSSEPAAKGAKPDGAKKKGNNMISDVAEFQITNLPGDVKDAIAFFVSKGYIEQSF